MDPYYVFAFVEALNVMTDSNSRTAEATRRHRFATNSRGRSRRRNRDILLPTKRGASPRSVVQLLVGLVLFGVSVSLMLVAGLGVNAWDVLHQGVAGRTVVSFGWVVNGISLLALVAWIPLRQRPGIGTVANALVVGVVADAALRVLSTPESATLRLGMFAAGILANAFATGLYIGAGLGPGPRDGLMTGLAARTGASIRTVRTGIELTVLSLGWALGGPVGIGTLVFAVTIGPLVQFFLIRFDRSMARVDASGPKPAATAATPDGQILPPW